MSNENKPIANSIKEQLITKEKPRKSENGRLRRANLFTTCLGCS